jgi:hypothetical protein
MRRMLLVVVLVFALSLMGSAVSAQTGTICGGLSDEDCAILVASEAAMAELSAASFDFDLRLDVEGLPDGEPDVNFILAGSGAYAMDLAVIEGLGEPSTPEEILAVSGQALGAFAGELSLTLTVPDMMAMEMGMPFTQITLELALVEGIGYLNFDSLDQALGGMLAMQGLTGWGGIDLTEVIAELAPMFMMPEFSEMFEDEMGAADLDEAELLRVMEPHFVIERGADVDGAAVFVYTVDMAGLLSEPEFQELFQDQAAITGADPMELEEMMMMAGMLGDSMSVQAVSMIDLNTFYMTSFSVDVNLDMAMLMAMEGEEVPDDARFAVSIILNYDDFNTATVSAPAGAVIADIDEIFGMLFGMGMEP